LAEPAFLIAGLSARALAASARHAGQRAVALDLFGDEDLQAAVLDHAVVPGDPSSGFDEAALLTAAQRLAPAGRGHRLVYGGGFEAQPGLLAALGQGRAICGNTPETLARLKHPRTFFALLDELGLPYPEVALLPPADPAGWLVKRIGGAGGSHIRPAGGIKQAAGLYFQRHTNGRPVSALIAGDGDSGRLLGFSEQWPSPDGAAQPFRFGGAAQPAIVPPKVFAAVAEALSPLVRASGLRGLASLDLLVGDEDFVVLEINPRAGATLDIFDAAGDGSLFTLHVASCDGQLTDRWRPPAMARALQVVYAEEPLEVTARQWPDWVADRPRPGTRIGRGDPICTVLAEAATAAEARQVVAERQGRILDALARVKEPLG
jgi:predicted ATP-grasp superfamily ATP-dependent carboligase